SLRLEEKRNADQSKLDNSADGRTIKSAPTSPVSDSETHYSSTECFSTGRRLQDHGSKALDANLRMRKPSVDLDAAYDGGNERTFRSDVVKIHNTRSRSKSTSKSRGTRTSRIRPATAKQSPSSPSRPQSYRRQRVDSQRTSILSAEPRNENLFGRTVRNIQLLCQEMILGVMIFSKTLMVVLQALCLGSSIIAWILAAYLLSIIFILLLGLIIPGLVAICFLPPVPTAQLDTSSSRSQRQSSTESMTYPRRSINEGSECRLHKPYLQWIEHDTLSITPEEKGVLMTNHSELCSVLEDTSNDLRHYYQHIDWFSVLLHRSTTANAGTETRPTTATGPPSRLQIQKMNSKRVSEFISQWQKDYDGLVTLGVEFAGDIDHFRHRLLTLRTRLSDLQGHVAGARQDIVNKWPFLRRLCRDVGLIRYEADETRDYSDALDVLNPWLKATIKQEKLLALVWTNVTASRPRRTTCCSVLS
ncbi:MAG: hypothetical protein Q9215_005999, partial [Flavoplaca cf. flavocitrina]